MTDDPPPVLHVLLVDDDQAQLDLLGLIVARQRPAWKVESRLADPQWLAAAGADPAAQVGRARLVLVDYRLGEGQVLSILRGLATVCTPVVMSGSTATVDCDACREAGAAAVVDKPYTMEEAEDLLAICDRLMDADAS